MRRAALVAFSAALVLFAIAAIPFVTREREQPASVPSPPPLSQVALDEIAPGGTLCMRDIAIEQHSQVARIQVGTFGKPGPPLTLAVSGPAYRATARQEGGYADNEVHSLAITPPRDAQLVRVCLRNDGDDRIALYAAADSARSRAKVSVAGKRLRATPALAFYESRKQSIADRVGVTVERMTTFRGSLGHATWPFWLVLVGFVIVIPAGAGLAIWRDWR
jgi:hypothetical protein